MKKKPQYEEFDFVDPHSDMEYIEKNLHLVPLEIARVLDKEERRQLVGNLLDQSDSKSISPVGKNFAARKQDVLSLSESLATEQVW